MYCIFLWASTGSIASLCRVAFMMNPFLHSLVIFSFNWTFSIWLIYPVLCFFFSFCQSGDKHEMGLSELVNKVLIGTDDLYVMCTHTLKYLFVIHSRLGSVPGSLVDFEIWTCNSKYVLNRLVIIFTLVLFYTRQNIRKLAFLPVLKFLSCNPHFEASFLFVCE